MKNPESLIGLLKEAKANTNKQIAIKKGLFSSYEDNPAYIALDKAIAAIGDASSHKDEPNLTIEGGKPYNADTLNDCRVAFEEYMYSRKDKELRSYTYTANEMFEAWQVAWNQRPSEISGNEEAIRILLINTLLDVLLGNKEANALVACLRPYLRGGSTVGIQPEKATSPVSTTAPEATTKRETSEISDDKPPVVPKQLYQDVYTELFDAAVINERTGDSLQVRCERLTSKVMKHVVYFWPKSLKRESVTGWQPIETAPRDKAIDTMGTFLRKRSGGTPKKIRFTDDYISENTVNPLVGTYHEYEGAEGTYTRTHWMPLPNPPEIEGGL